MASPPDAPSRTPPTIDPQSFQQYRSTEVIPPFSGGVIVPPLPDVTLNPAHVPFIQQMPQMPIFQPELDASPEMPLSMQIQMSNPPSNANPMDPMSPSNTKPTQSAVIDFSVPLPGFPPDHRMGGLEGIDPQQQLISSPTATTASTTASHASSPALNGMANAYIMGTSSLASALDGMANSRSRSGSSASPGLLASGSSDLGFSSTTSLPSSHDSSLSYPPAFEHTFAVRKEESPEIPAGSDLSVLGDLLSNIAKTADSGSKACSLGQTTETRFLVDALKHNVVRLSNLIAEMQLADGSPTASSAASPSGQTATGSPGSSASLVSKGLEVNSQPLLNPPHTFTTLPTLAPESGLSVDASDMSRKRCASTVAEERVVKAMKLEPQDDILLQNPQTLTVLQSLPSQQVMSAPVPTFPYTPTHSLPATMATIVDQSVPPSVPSSLPPSRAPSPSRLKHSILPQSQNPSQIHSSLHFPQAPQPPALQSTDFIPVPSSASVPLPGAVWHVPEVRPLPRHSHTLSGGSIISHQTVPASASGSATSIGYTPAPSNVFPSPPRTAPQPVVPILPSVASSAVPAMNNTRTSRSSSISHPIPYHSVNSDVSVPVYDSFASRPSTSALHSTRPSSPEGDYDGEEDDSDEGYYYSPQQRISPPTGAHGDGDFMEDIQDSNTRKMNRTSPSAEGGSTSHANEVPVEYQAEVKRIFFEFLNKTCSNLDATDAKGEPIHQTLMAKKMQRLDESPDFRPFKFRIQAFTNAFLEELAHQGYPEEKIPMKKIRNFLWNQPYISRFNEEGKKSKSKGNHIWHVDAKKSDGSWTFRPFQRRLAGAPPGVAYVGLRWSWTPRIWDPQSSRSNLSVAYSSPSMPSWLSWKEDVLSGIPPHDAQSCDITVEARFTQDGKEELLTHTVHVSIAPMAAMESFTPSRRPSLVGDIHNPRRVMSDSVLPQTSPPRPLRVPPGLNPVPAVVAPDSQVVQVLTTAAQRVAQEAQSQVVASPMDVGPELQALAKQQHVLTVTAQAFNTKTAEVAAGDSSTPQTHALAAAAQLVVLQAARQVAADRTVAAVTSGMSAEQASAPQVTVKEVSVATQSAVAQAVEMVGPLSSEVDVMMTAKSLLQQQTQQITASPMAVDPSAMTASLDPVRPHSTGTLLPASYTMVQNVAAQNGFYPQ